MTACEDQDLIALYNEGFKQFDPDSKGFIKARVLQQALKHFGFNPSNIELEQLIVDIDSNGNGRIEMEEFIQATRRLTDKTKATKEARESFHTFDIMNSGFIKAADLKQTLMYIMTGSSEAEKEDIITHFNLEDGERNISFDEFSQILSMACTSNE